MPLRVYHTGGKLQDADTGARYDATERVYRSAGELPERFRQATRYVFDEDTEGTFGDDELDGAWGHHTGCRIWVEGSNYDKVRKLYLMMGDKARAEGRQAQLRRLRSESKARAAKATGAAQRPPRPAIDTKQQGGTSAAPATASEPVHIIVTVNLVGVPPGTAVEPPHIEVTTGKRTNGYHDDEQLPDAAAILQAADLQPAVEEIVATTTVEVDIGGHGPNGSGMNGAAVVGSLPRVGVTPEVATAIKGIHAAAVHQPRAN